MIQTVFGWAFLKVEMFSNLLWKNARKLNSFDTAHVKIWRDLNAKDKDKAFVNALEEFLDIPRLTNWKDRREMLMQLFSTDKESHVTESNNHHCLHATKTNTSTCNNEMAQYVGNNGHVKGPMVASEVLELLKERLSYLINSASDGKSMMYQELYQHSEEPESIQSNFIKGRMLEKCIHFRHSINELEGSLSGDELLDSIIFQYTKMIDEILNTCIRKPENTTVDDTKPEKSNFEQTTNGNDQKQLQSSTIDDNATALQHGIHSEIAADTAKQCGDKQECSRNNVVNLSKLHVRKNDDAKKQNIQEQYSNIFNEGVEGSTVENDDEMGQLEKFRTLQCLTMQSSEPNAENIGNVFLLVAKKVSRILEQNMNKYRLKIIHMESSNSVSQHPLNVIDSSVIQPYGMATAAIRIPILQKGMPDKTYSLINKIQSKKLRYLWAIDMAHLQKCGCVASDETQDLTVQEDSVAKYGVGSMVSLFDVTSYFESEKDVPSESPSTWLPSIDKRFYSDLIGTDRRKRAKFTQERCASPVNTQGHSLIFDATASPMSTIVSRKPTFAGVVLPSPKKNIIGGNVPFCMATDMAGGDVLTGEPKGICRQLWETEGNNGDSGVSWMSLHSPYSTSLYSATRWENEDLQKGFESAFELFGTPKSPKEQYHFKYKNERSPVPVKLSESIKALRRLQKEFEDRDIKATDSVQNASTNSGYYATEPECLQACSTNDIPSYYNKYVTPIHLNNPNSQQSYTTQHPKDTGDFNEFVEQDRCIDIPEQEYYCLGNKDDLWDDAQNTEFDFESHNELEFDAGKVYYSSASNAKENQLYFDDESCNPNDLCANGYINGYQHWSDHDITEDKPATTLDTECAFQSHRFNQGTLQGSCNVSNIGDTQIQSRVHQTAHPQHHDWSLSSMMTAKQTRARPTAQKMPPASTPHVPHVLQATNAVLTYNSNIRINQQMQQAIPCGFVQRSNCSQFQGYPLTYIPPLQSYYAPQICGQQQYAFPMVQNHLVNVNYLRAQQPMLPQVPVIPALQQPTLGHQAQGMIQPSMFNPLRPQQR